MIRLCVWYCFVHCLSSSIFCRFVGCSSSCTSSGCLAPAAPEGVGVAVAVTVAAATSGGDGDGDGDGDGTTLAVVVCVSCVGMVGMSDTIF